MVIPIYVEDEIGKKWDRCFTDGILKFGSGMLIGGVISLLFFKKKKWPIVMGTGFGVGMAWKNCEKDLNATITAANKCL